MEDWKLTVFIECKAKEMPQQNLMSKTAFATLAARGLVMMTADIMPMVE